MIIGASSGALEFAKAHGLDIKVSSQNSNSQVPVSEDAVLVQYEPAPRDKQLVSSPVMQLDELEQPSKQITKEQSMAEDFVNIDGAAKKEDVKEPDDAVIELSKKSTSDDFDTAEEYSQELAQVKASERDPLSNSAEHLEVRGGIVSPIL